METLVEAARLTLVVTVRLGIPVLALGVVGLLFYHSSRRTSSRSTATRAGLLGAESRGQATCCWLGRRCLPTVRDNCPAFLHPETPCWQATKPAAGRLRAECLSCAFFLPYLRHPATGAMRSGEATAQPAARR